MRIRIQGYSAGNILPLRKQWNGESNVNKKIRSWYLSTDALT